MRREKRIFGIGSAPFLFDGLAITREKDLCGRYMGKYPMIFLALKSVDMVSFSRAKKQRASLGQFEDGYVRAVSFFVESWSSIEKTRKNCVP